MRHVEEMVKSGNAFSDVYVKCEECDGKRFNNETLEVKYKNNSISDVLQMPVDEAKNFKAIPSIAIN